jgi:hypothetical protein
MTGMALTEHARRTARADWLERRCFEILGGWVVDTLAPAAKLLFARHSHHHAWHAEVFERLAPVANGFPGSEKDAPGGPDSGAWADLLGELRGESAAAARAAGFFGVVVPAKIAGYERWLEAANPASDAPLIRWLGFVLRDEREGLAEAQAVLGVSTPTRDSRLAALATSLF